MSSLSIGPSMPCYHLDLSARKATPGTYDYSKMLAQQARMAEEERSHPQIGTVTLTEREVQDLAARYDPTNMTNAEYNSLIDELAAKGVLGRSETYGVYSDRVVLRPGHLSEGGISPGPVRTLADMGGDALRWTSNMAQWRGGSFDTIRADAFQKIAGILEEMDAYRLEQEKAAADAAHADEQLAAMDRAIFEQKGNVDTQVNGEELLERLSGPARDTLERIKSDRPITYEEWDDLCGSLWESGAISRAEYDIAMGRIIPVGYTDENGERVEYEGVAERFGLVDLLRRLSGREELGASPLAWNGDPLAYLDAWIAELTDWREELSRRRNADGTAKYDDFSPIDGQVEACSKVSGLVRGLLGQLEG